jgi:hypothetical protein
LSDAVALTVVLVLTVAPAEGAVTLTVGAVESTLVLTVNVTLALAAIALFAESWQRTYRVFDPVTSPVVVVLCSVPPVVLNVFAMLAYEVSELLHLHVAASFVVTLSVVLVVPALSAWPELGLVMVAVGGVVSAGAATLKLTLALAVIGFPAESWQRTYRV